MCWTLTRGVLMNPIQTEALLGYAREAAERCRRIETKQTKHLVSIGFDTGSQMPLWHDDGPVGVPSRATSLVDIMSVVPIDWDREYEITVLFKGHFLGV